MPDFVFQHPWYLLAALPATVLVFWILRTTSTPLPSVRRVIGGGALAAAVVALILCAAGLFWQVSSDQRTVWVLVDRSLSVGSNGERRLPAVLEDLASSLPDEDYVGVILFDETASVLLQPVPARELRSDYELPAWDASDETYIGNALQLAAQQSVPGTAPFAILLSDGYDSTARYGGDVLREVRDSGVRLFTIPIDSDPLPEIAVADFGARLIGKEELVIAVDLVVFSTVQQQVIPQIKVNGKLAENVESDKLTSRGRLNVGIGRNPVRLLLRPADRASVYVLEVSVAAEQNTFPRNDSLKIRIAGPGASRVLLLHSQTNKDQPLQRALERIGLEVTSGTSALMPSEMVELSKYQVLVLSDVAATEFSSAQLSLIERFVRNGGGLAMLGGPNSFAPGGYYESAVEKILPVTCDVVEKGRKQVPALIVALDKSGSMGAEVGKFTKMDLANEGCVRSIRLVPLGSYFGMLAVDTDPDWVVPLEILKDRDYAVGLARRNETGGGGIFVDVAMSEAIASMRQTKASSKHIVLFSDGRDTNRQEGVLEMVTRANAEDEITFSAICLGRGEDEGFLQNFARVGNGRYFLVNDPNDLPAVFSREAAAAAGNFIREDPFRPWSGLPGSLTDGVDFEAATTPELLGYVAVTAREEAHVWLWADEDKERPILATWNVELGKALAFTSDAKDRWADNWLNWDKFDEMWQRWIRKLLPEPERIDGVESEWSINRAGPVLTLSFFDADGNPRELQDPIAEIESADGTTGSADVLPVGSGTYRVQFSRTGSGIYAANVRERPSTDGVRTEERLVAREHQIFVPLEELMQRPSDTAGLQAMADTGQGKIISGPREILNVTPEGGLRAIWPYTQLLWIAVISLFLFIGARRFPSVWRRKIEEQRRRKQDEDRMLTARAAYERVRKTLDERNKPLVAARSARYDSAPPPPPMALPSASDYAPPPKPDPAKREKEKPAAKTGDDASLLSAMRNVRKQMDERRRDEP